MAANNCILADYESLNDVISKIFYDCSQSPKLREQYDFKPLVEFAKSQEASHWGVFQGSKDRHKLVDCLKNLSVDMKSLLKKSDEDTCIRRIKLEGRIEALDSTYIDELENEPQAIRFINFYQIILDFWSELKEYPNTYTTLMYLAKMGYGWPNDNESQKEFEELYKNIIGLNS